MSGAIHLRSLYGFVAWTGKILPFFIWLKLIMELVGYMALYIRHSMTV
jgi:hypothetical protein